MMLHDYHIDIDIEEYQDLGVVITITHEPSMQAVQLTCCHEEIETAKVVLMEELEINVLGSKHWLH
jgi:hypothetical protein